MATVPGRASRWPSSAHLWVPWGRCAPSGVDEVSAFVCPTSANNDATGSTSHAMVWKRMPRFETQRFAKLRATDLVMTARAGFSKLQDGTTTAIITRAS